MPTFADDNSNKSYNIMGKKLLTAAVLAVLMAGCSSENDDTQTEQPPKSSVVNNEIEGVWRNGEYFLSFSPEGFIGAYLLMDKENVISETYTLRSDTIFTRDERSDIDFIVEDVTRDSIYIKACCYREVYKSPWESAVDTLQFSYHLVKTTERPCKQEHAICGKTFSYIGHNLKYSQPNDSRTSTESEVTCRVSTFNRMERTFSTDVNQYWGWGQFNDYYVYLPPKMYFIEHNNSPIFFATTNKTVGILVVSIDKDGDIKCSEDLE